MFLVKFSNMPNERVSYYILESIFMHVFVAIDGIHFHYILLFYKIIFSFFFKEIFTYFFWISSLLKISLLLDIQDIPSHNHSHSFLDIYLLLNKPLLSESFHLTINEWITRDAFCLKMVLSKLEGPIDSSLGC